MGSSALWIAAALSCPIQPVAAQADRVAQGQAAQVEPAGYREAVDQALAEYQVLNFEEARALFTKAHKLFPNARTLRGLGMTEFELRNYRASVEMLVQALAAEVRPLQGQLRRSSLELLARAREFLGELVVRVQPPGARIVLDGSLIEADRALELQIGNHPMQVDAAGYISAKRIVIVKGGDSQVVLVTLVARDSATSTPVTSVASAKVASAKVTRPQQQQAAGPGPLPCGIGGGAGATLVTGGVLLALAQSDIAQVEDAPKDTSWTEVAGAYDAAPLKSGVGIALLAASALGIAGGLWWALTGSGSDEPKPTASSVRFGLAGDRVLLSGMF